MPITNLFTDSRVKPLHFARTVGPGTSGTTTYDVKKDGTIEEVQFRVYGGAEDTLKTNIYVVDESTDSKKKVVETPDEDSSIAGNDDVFTFRASKEVTSDDEILIEYENEDTSNPHRYKINIEIDRAGGTLSSIFR